jgi:hypothetical protein
MPAPTEQHLHRAQRLPQNPPSMYFFLAKKHKKIHKRTTKAHKLFPLVVTTAVKVVPKDQRSMSACSSSATPTEETPEHTFRLAEAIAQIQEDFYNDSGGKKGIFKKQQKFDCAAQVGSQLSLELLLRHTCWVMPNATESVYINYPILKTFATPDLFEVIVNHIIAVCNYVKGRHAQLVIWLNLDGFTVSAVDRYRGLISLFSEKCLAQNTQFSLVLQELRILNAPTAIEHIRTAVKTLIISEIHSKIRVLNRAQSQESMQEVASYLA